MPVPNTSILIQHKVEIFSANYSFGLKFTDLNQGVVSPFVLTEKMILVVWRKISSSELLFTSQTQTHATSQLKNNRTFSTADANKIVCSDGHFCSGQIWGQTNRQTERCSDGHFYSGQTNRLVPLLFIFCLVYLMSDTSDRVQVQVEKSF